MRSACAHASVFRSQVARISKSNKYRERDGPGRGRVKFLCISVQQRSLLLTRRISSDSRVMRTSVRPSVTFAPGACIQRVSRRRSGQVCRLRRSQTQIFFFCFSWVKRRTVSFVAALSGSPGDGGRSMRIRIIITNAVWYAARKRAGNDSERNSVRPDGPQLCPGRGRKSRIYHSLNRSVNSRYFKFFLWFKVIRKAIHS